MNFMDADKTSISISIGLIIMILTFSTLGYWNLELGLFGGLIIGLIAGMLHYSL